MDPRKNALKDFLIYSRNALQNHLDTAVGSGQLPASQAKQSLDNFDDRSELILQAFDKQSGGAIPSSLPAVPTSLPAVDLGKVPSEAEIKAEIDKLINFSPAEHIAEPVKPILDASLWVFIPKVRETVKKIVGTFFILGSLDKLPIFGPLIGSSMDIAAAFMPALGATFQNMLPNIIGLAPIPYAAFIGEAAGYVFSSVMMFMTLMTQVSRGEFMEALEAGAGLLPVVGTTLMMYVNKGKKVYDKFIAMKEKIVVSLAQIKGLILYLVPMVSKSASKLLTNLLPIFDTLLKSAAINLLGPTNYILDNVKPFLAVAKKRLASIEKSEALAAAAVKKGGRYTKRTRRAKRKDRKSKTRGRK